jgi:hypothetical protein
MGEQRGVSRATPHRSKVLTVTTLLAPGYPRPSRLNCFHPSHCPRVLGLGGREGWKWKAVLALSDPISVPFRADHVLGRHAPTAVIGYHYPSYGDSHGLETV